MINDPQNDENLSTDQNVISDPESIIDRFLDIINIRRLLITIFNKTPFKVTNSFISGLILFIFLIWLYFADEFSRLIIILVLIGFLILDFMGKNVDSIRKLLFSEDSNKAFLENFCKYSFDECSEQTLLRKFTQKNINFYLNKIRENPNGKYGFVLENTLLRNELSMENCDILFSQEFLQFNLLRHEIVITLLLKHKNKLSKDNLSSLYNYYHANERIIKYIFATQIQSEFLINENIKLKVVAEKFELGNNLKFRDLKRKLPIFPKDRVNLLKMLIFVGIILYFSLYLVIISILVPKNLVLSNGYMNPTYANLSLIVFVGTAFYSITMVFIVWHILGQRQNEKLEEFKKFVDSA